MSISSLELQPPEKLKPLERFLLHCAGAYPPAVPRILLNKYMFIGFSLLIFSVLKGAVLGYGISLLKIPFWLGTLIGFIVCMIIYLTVVGDPKRNPSAPPFYGNEIDFLEMKVQNSSASSSRMKRHWIIPCIAMGVSLSLTIIAANVLFIFGQQEVIIQQYKSEIDTHITEKIQPELIRAEKEYYHADLTINRHAEKKRDMWRKELDKLLVKQKEVPKLSQQRKILGKLKNQEKYKFINIGEIIIWLVFGGIEIIVLFSKRSRYYDAYDHKMYQLELTEIHKINAQADEEKRRIEAQSSNKRNASNLPSSKSNPFN